MVDLDRAREVEEDRRPPPPPVERLPLMMWMLSLFLASIGWYCNCSYLQYIVAERDDFWVKCDLMISERMKGSDFVTRDAPKKMDSTTS